ncbi:ABC transporter ATP-binding protein [Microbacterium hominis]|uniref:ABC transporter ATP-binding protein n=1 Tax=Microbacterium hominis TaxID=162426 RepID=UPI0009EF4548|nr:ABC transporter ATP-binding protein [Microbacterium hominis]
MPRPVVAAPTPALLPIAAARSVRAVLRALLRHHRGRLAGVVALLIVAAGLGLVTPACLGRIVDAVISGAGPAAVAAWVLAAGVGALAAVGCSLWGMRQLAALVQDVLARLREDVFASAMRLPVAIIDDGESADLISRVTGDVDAVAEAGGNVVPTLLSAVFAIAVSLVALAALDPWLALAGLACVPCYVVGTRRFLRRSRVVFREVRAREAARSQAVLEAVEGGETLAALNEQDEALALVQERAESSIAAQIDGVRLRNRLFRWINGGEAIGLVCILATGFALHADGALTVGTVTTAALVFHRLFDPIGQLILGLDEIQRATVGLARLVGVIELARETRETREAREAQETASAVSTARPARAPRAHVGVSVEAVSFHYATTRRGLRDVTLRVEPGTTTALVGASGSGKSTLARLIAGHYPPSAGRVRLDDPTVQPYYISQELHHFRGGIADNLRWAAPEATRHEMDAALRAVGAAWALVPGDGVDDDRAGGGPRLDEGRIQQLAIARALLADPAVVILDEATADVGLQHRPAVEAAIERLRVDRTIILIAHRLHQAATADRIVVFASGEVQQCGTHDELNAVDGPYRRLWRAQVGRDADPERTEIR